MTTQVNTDYPQSPVFTQTVELTDAQVKALPTTGVDLVASPGPGKMILPILLYLRLRSSAGYSNLDISIAMKLQYPSPSGSSFGLLGGIDLFLGSSSNLGESSVPSLDIPNFLDPAASNKALQLKLNNGGSGNLTGGNATNALLAQIFYSIVNGA